MELLKSEAGIDLLHVPYRGVAPAVLAVNRGEVDLYCSDIPGALNLLQGDKVDRARHHQREALADPAGHAAPSPRRACRTMRRPAMSASW